MDIIANPIASTALTGALVRTGAVMAAGLGIMTLTQITRLRQMTRSLAFRKFCSWIVILPVLLLIIFAGWGPFAALLLFILWKSSGELARLFRLSPYHVKIFGLNQALTGVVLVLAPERSGLLPMVYLLSTLFAAVVRDQTHDAVKQLALVLTGNLWVGFTLALLAGVHRGPMGEGLITVIFGMVIVSDVFAYLFGGIAKRTGIGRRALSANISPNKTVAGAVGNIVGAGIAYAVFGGALDFSIYAGGVLTLLLGVGATVGDLAESLVKRVAGVKDAGTLIPYHGGMLDRVDSLLVTAPLSCLFLELMAEASKWSF